MPQLNPSPWFMILLFSWLVLITIIPLKIMKHTITNDPTMLAAMQPEIEPWNWPWF
uniref:ATP synthase complex subunit 8 n=1 Tax=Abramites hypselonotus TaxID=1396860 RepID=A0A8A9ITB4_9TELE|nr:ATP synthase F0 subunit 8 [Abramites hypselonotus]QTS03710.1 ATP synthase F0 subunit 8 [Abramites hypselonotus]